MSITLTLGGRLARSAEPKVTLIRTPGGGIQPQAVVDNRGVLHVIYFAGNPGGGDVFYVRRAAGALQFSKPRRVNSVPDTVIATGTVRGAHLAVGRSGRVHVAWMGARPEGPKKIVPMYYSRLNDAGTAFEPQRNVMRFAAGLDGGASVAADNTGNVYVVWHANPDNSGEAHRRVWMARSRDEGKSFAREVAIDPPLDGKPTGACGCCGMRAFADTKGSFYVFYRAATEDIHRDMILLVSSDYGVHFTAQRVANWELNACPMSTDFISQTGNSMRFAWETAGQVFYDVMSADSGKTSAAISPAGDETDRKHPVVAANSRGETLLAWTKGTAWERGGTVEWQVFDPAGRPTIVRGAAPGVPVWGLVAAYAGRDGNFTILY
ncbi:MAG: sialidase family protein [Terriglobia bacterium]